MAVVIGLTAAVKIQELTDNYAGSPEEGMHYEIACTLDDHVFALDQLRDVDLSSNGVIKYHDAQGRAGLVSPDHFDTCVYEQRPNTDDDYPGVT